MNALVSLSVCLAAGAFTPARFEAALVRLEPETAFVVAAAFPLVGLEVVFLADAAGAGAGDDGPSEVTRRMLPSAGDSMANSAPATPNQTLVRTLARIVVQQVKRFYLTSGTYPLSTLSRGGCCRHLSPVSENLCRYVSRS